MKHSLLIAAGMVLTSPPVGAQPRGVDLRDQASAAMRRAAEFYRAQVAVRGGYVYYYSLDLKKRLGEGVASPTEIWVQPPGTPTVGMAYLAAYRATGERFYLEAARETAAALIYGQLKSGGWTNVIDFDPRGKRVALYRNGKGRGRNYSSLDDGITQHALRFLMRMDEALKFKDEEVHEAAETALPALLAAQFPNGGFPQVWSGPVAAQPVLKATYPDDDWRTENRIKEYWNLYTLNDGLAETVADTLLEAEVIYAKTEQAKRCRDAAKKLGDFLILAQMPEPQPAWAQQYDYEMRPVWARKFEPAAITGGESQGAIETLLKIHERTGEAKYLAPIPQAIEYLKASRLADGRLARFYELRTNKPLYMTRRYELTYDDRDVPTHYGWKVTSRLDQLERRYQELKARRRAASRAPDPTRLESKVREIIHQLDDEGRWISRDDGERLVGQPKFARGEPYLSSAVFARNLETLSAYLEAVTR